MTAIARNNTSLDKTFQFEIRLDWLGRKSGILTAKDVKDTIRAALPQAFGGTGDEWSPEHLFLGSISSCFMTTYLVFADKLGFELDHFESHVQGKIELVNGRYEFTSVNIKAMIYIGDESLREKAILALGKAQKYCLVSNSVKAEINYDGEVLLDKHPLNKEIPSFSVTRNNNAESKISTLL